VRRPRFPIAIKLTLSFAIVALLPIALIALFAFRSLTASHEERENQRRKEVLTGVKNEIKLFIDETRQQVTSISNYAAIQRYLTAELYSQDYFQQDFINLGEFLLGASAFDFLDFVDTNGIIRVRGQDPNDFNSETFKDVALFNEFENPRVPVVRITRRETIDDRIVPSLEVIMPVMNFRNSIGGLVIGGHYLDEDFFHKLGNPGNEGAVILVDSTGNGIGSNFKSVETEDAFFNQIAGIGIDGLVFPLTDENPDWKKAEFNRNILAAVSLEDLFTGSEPVYLVVTYPQGEFTSFLDSISYSMYAASLLAAGFALLAGLILAGSISAPIRRLSAAAKHFAQTGTFKPMKIKSADEIEDLVKSFSDMAEELDVNTRRMIQAEKLAAWRDVARKLAHEIKNPLFPIRLNIETLQKYHKSDPQAFEETFTDATSTIMEEVDHLKRLADEFSSFARMPKPLLEPNDLHKSLKKIEEMFRSDNTITYEFEIPDDLPSVIFDDDQLRMALVNLIKNASESFDGKPGTVSVYAHSLPEENKVLIGISDTGPGLDDDELKKIFTPYYTTKESGTGLGLAIVENIINDHGGKIWAESQKGDGTTFFITLNTHRSGV
jgi:signal transduction histidine kinase